MTITVWAQSVIGMHATPLARVTRSTEKGFFGQRNIHLEGHIDSFEEQRTINPYEVVSQRY